MIFANSFNGLGSKDLPHVPGLSLLGSLSNICAQNKYFIAPRFWRQKCKPNSKLFVNDITDAKQQFWNQTETRKLPLVSARWCNFWKHYSLFVLPNLKPALQDKLMLAASAVVKLDSVISSAKKTLSQQSAGFKITTPRLVQWLSRILKYITFFISLILFWALFRKLFRLKLPSLHFKSLCRL